MSCANAAAALAATSLQRKPPSLLFPPPIVPLQTPISRRRFLSRSLSYRASTRRRIVAEASSDTTPAAESGKKRVLIVNTNSGGHAVIGFYFAGELLGAGHEVTILTVGDEGSDKMQKPPFTRFSELVSAGGRTVWGDPADVGKIVGAAAFDVVLDNNGKDLDSVKVLRYLKCSPDKDILFSPNEALTVEVYIDADWAGSVDDRRPVADWAKSIGVKQFLFISSAGIYKSTDELPHVEEDPVKDDAGHAAVERYIADLSFSSWAIFRPQYMIGSGNNKDCEEWFFDRIVRRRPILIPESGMQLTNISHVRDLSSMLSLAVADPVTSSRTIFNCVSDRAVTLDGFAKLCARAAGLDAKIIQYDPKSVGVDAKKAFPFRNMHFYAEPRAAKKLLGWTSTTNLHEDLKERFDEYVGIGRDKKQMKFDLDDKILESLKVPVAV
ncbi:hypothetical protein KSP39_PZI003817 [Platanthera zijinensis]|uniref:NAD-dependent epimerase/dehydratase domain-containing protein n=1 Tax=Platanthera zijinensis TaxID=2320716 RepID=A0AAP0BW86_9ASPA